MVEGRWVSRVAAGLLGCAMLVLAGPTPAHASVHVASRRDSDHDPLTIAITGLTPGVLPDRGPIQVSGTVTNEDSTAWRQVNLYPYLDTDECVASGTCAAPMTTAEGLAEGAASDPASPVGTRITDASATHTIERIDPGESVSFTMTISQAVLRSRIADPQPGVYWFGVQAIGQSDTSPRDGLADGRARTFLPYLPPDYGRVGPRQPSPRIDTAIIVPVRAPVQHLRDGRLAKAHRWLEDLSTSGSLGDALALGTASGSLPVTWLVDPAVPDAVHELAEGNPARIVPAAGQQSSPSASPSTSNGPSEGTSGSSSAGPLATAAASWLDQAKRLFGTGELLTLPYGDTDLTSSHLTAKLYAWSREQTGVLNGWKLPARKVITSPDGYLDPAGLAATRDNALVLVGDQALPRPASGGTVGSHPFAALSSAAADGGPEPQDRWSPVGLRQRILSEAAVRLIAGSDQPLLVQLPPRLGSGAPSELWAGLEQPWLHLTTVQAAMRGAATVDPTRLRYPASVAARNVPESTQADAVGLVGEGDLLQSIVTPTHDPDEPEATNAGLARAVRAEALAATSYSMRGNSETAPRLVRSRVWLDDQLKSVSISAPPGVTLSSSEGSFSVTVTNDLDVPVTVDIATQATSARVAKTDPIELAAHSRTSVRLDAHTRGGGVHNVRLILTDKHGRPIGGTVTVPIRSGSVGVVIWAILATGAGILLFAIVVRLVRRLRGRPEASA